MRQILVKAFYWSWIITLPAVLLGGYITYRAVDRFYTFEVRYDPTPGNISLEWALKYEYGRLKQRLRVAHYQLQGARSELKKIELFAPESGLAVLKSRLPQSGFEYIKARLKIGDQLEKAKIKYRGDFLSHWAYDKKSTRIKTSKNKLFEGMRSFNLLAPKFSEQLNNYLGYRLAEEMGLVSPRTELVRLILNNENLGVYILVEQLEELTLRRTGLMPADVYQGEIVGKDRYTGGHAKSLFESAGVWEKIAVNNHYPAESMAPLEQFLSLIQKRKSPEAQAALSSLLDMEAWGRFSAFEALAQTKHFDAIHNWRLYYDPWRLKIIPIVWDPVGWARPWRAKSGETVTAEIIEQDLHEALFLNGDFLRARNRALQSFFTSGKSDSFLRFAADTVSLMSREVFLDPLLIPVEPEYVVSAMKELETTIQRGFYDIEKGLGSETSRVEYAVMDNHLKLAVGGKGTVEKIRIDLKQSLPALPHGLIQYKVGEERLLQDISSFLSVNRNSIFLHGGFLPDLYIAPSNQHAQKYKLESNPGVYEIIFENIDLQQDILDVSVDSGMGFEKISRREVIDSKPFKSLNFPVSPVTTGDPEIWSGDVIISNHKIVRVPVVIQPGTQVLLESNAVLVFENRLNAVGTEAAPIRFVARAAGQDPWGAVVLRGARANGSRLQHCIMSDGSGNKTDLAEYTAMLSVHDVQNIYVSDCLFKDNHQVDDMVHTVYSNVRFERCRFERARADALDIDISEAVIVDSVFQESGNDAIDLMSSKVQVTGSLMQKNGDKGISVGEGSSLFAADNLFAGNEIGVQSKDASIALMFNQTFESNNQSLHAYRKNWRYGDGGHIILAKSKILNSEKEISADKYSSIYLSDSYTQNAKVKKKRISFDKVDEINDGQAVDSKILPGDLISRQSIVDIFKQVSPDTLSRIDANVRGAKINGGIN